jgi:hypothetical protein
VIIGLANMGYERREAENAVIHLAAQAAQEKAGNFAELSKTAQEELLLRRAIVELAHER